MLVFLHFLSAHLIPALKHIESISKISKSQISILSNVHNFHSLEVVHRVSETQLEVGEHFNLITWLLEGQVKIDGSAYT